MKNKQLKMKINHLKIPENVVKVHRSSFIVHRSPGRANYFFETFGRKKRLTTFVVEITLILICLVSRIHYLLFTLFKSGYHA